MRVSEISEIVGHIKILRAELADIKDPERHEQILNEIEEAKKRKVGLFKSQSKIDHNESEFIHLFSQ